MKIRYETPQDGEYIEYLTQHCNGVYESFLTIKSKLSEDVNRFGNIEELDMQIRNHDASKYSDEEWYAYRNYFYPTDKSPKDEAAFDNAWLHHQHTNPHHWQHWTLLRDSGETVALDMPINYVIEMLCDWHSFSRKNPESTAYKWYNDNKKKMILSDATVSLIDEFLELFKEPLK